uniref:Putative secreted protein n=1 Tax=Ixodes ricinus TaxID=34613 RepID=A0A6B0UPM3_IXORI
MNSWKVLMTLIIDAASEEPTLHPYLLCCFEVEILDTAHTSHASLAMHGNFEWLYTPPSTTQPHIAPAQFTSCILLGYSRMAQHARTHPWASLTSCLCRRTLLRLVHTFASTTLRCVASCSTPPRH